MKRLALSLVGAALLAVGVVGIALANPGHPKGPKHHSPEIDASSLGSGLALLLGSGLIVVEKFRARK